MIDEPLIFWALPDWLVFKWIIGMAISLCLSVHILLKKTDHKASILWIALVWAIPFFGGLLYLLLGINRISRRASKLGIVSSSPLRSDSYKAASHIDPSFLELGINVSGNPPVPGNTVKIVRGNRQIQNLMIDLIDEAEKSVWLSSYIFRKDNLGLRVADALLKAQSRGVDVRVLLDGFGNSVYRAGIFRFLRKGGIKIQRFLFSIWPWRMPYLNLRNHRKILIIDRKMCLTGSSNIGDVNNQETHFHMEGPITSYFERQFEADWNLEKSAKANPIPPSIDIKGNAALRLIESGPNHHSENLRWILMGALGMAKKRIRIVTPYFVPDRGLISSLILARLRGVDIEIIIPGKSNYFFVDWASRHQIKPLIEAGCSIYLRNDGFDHSKFVTIDGAWCLFGSSNWDARSIRLNFEMDVECFDKDVCAELDGIMDSILVDNEALSSFIYETRSIPIRLRDAFARLALPYL